jgi:hypothetical protein
MHSIGFYMGGVRVVMTCFGYHGYIKIFNYPALEKKRILAKRGPGCPD